MWFPPFIYLFWIIFWERLRERERVGENPKQASRPAQSLLQGWISGPWDHDLSQNQEPEAWPTWATRMPLPLSIY